MAKKKLPGTPVQAIPVKGIKKGEISVVMSGSSAEKLDDYIEYNPVVSFVVPEPVISVGDIKTTGIKAESYEAGMQHLYEFAARHLPDRYNYALLMREEDDTFTLYERLNQPCWGSLREYGDKGTRPDDNWPGDLVSADRLFPATGKVEALSVVFDGTGSSNTNVFNRYIAEYAFNQVESPWKNLLKDIELVSRNDRFNGCVFKDCHIDPTALAQFLRHCASNYSSIPSKWHEIMTQFPDTPPKVAHLKALGMYGIAAMSGRVVLERFFNSNPFDLSNGGTLHDRESYNRPDRDYVFGGKNNEGVSVAAMTREQLIEEYNRIMNKDEEHVAA